MGPQVKTTLIYFFGNIWCVKQICHKPSVCKSGEGARWYGNRNTKQKTYATKSLNGIKAKRRWSCTSKTSDMLDRCLWIEHLASHTSRLRYFKITVAEMWIKEGFFLGSGLPTCQIYNLHSSFKSKCIETQSQNISFSSPVKSDFRALYAPLWVHWHSTGNCKHSHWINYQLVPPQVCLASVKKGKINNFELWSTCREPACQLL